MIPSAKAFLRLNLLPADCAVMEDSPLRILRGGTAYGLHESGWRVLSTKRRSQQRELLYLCPYQLVAT